MNHSRRKFIKQGSLTTLAGFGSLGLSLLSCQEDELDGENSNNSLSITGVVIENIETTKGGEATIIGKGFEIGDVITFKSTETYSTTVSVINATLVSFSLPESIIDGSYSLSVSRGSQSMALGSVEVTIKFADELPNIAGMSIKGVVSCNGEGISNVVVSDGYQVTTTNADGIYYLPSQKETGYVFISVPANYEVPTNGRIPQFFQILESKSSAVVEQKDFSLTKVDNTNHVVLALADWHLANRVDDLTQFVNNVLPDINETIAKYEAEGKKVYGLTLGDLTFDSFWYQKSFGIPEFVPYMNMVNCPVYNVIGNHDNDPYDTNDWLSEAEYRSHLGPTYYSFNLGNVHYVVLDNVAWINTGGAEGTVGDTNYDKKVTQNQIDWLKKDLATITDKSTPIVLAMHVPMFKRQSLDAYGNESAAQYNLDNSSELQSLLSDFNDVHLLSGHAHRNYTVEKDNLMEHNIGAVCGTWWWTNKNGYSGNHLSKEGSPGGYGVYKMNGNNIEWYYKGIKSSKDYQFRAYDLNRVHITAAEYASKVSESDMANYAEGYASVSSANEVLVHVWGYDSQWTVEMSENGVALDVSRVEAKDPLHIISYEAFRLNAGAVPTAGFVTGKTGNMFKITATSATSTIKIKVTDRFGNVYTETMERPKAFGLTIK